MKRMSFVSLCDLRGFVVTAFCSEVTYVFYSRLVAMRSISWSWVNGLWSTGSPVR